MTAPEAYTPEYCDAIREGCTEARGKNADNIQEIHNALFEKGGIVAKLGKTVSFSSVKWWVSLLLVPAILAVFAIYQSYVTFPLVYADQQSVAATEKRVTILEQKISALPTKEELKEIMIEVLKGTPAKAGTQKSGDIH